MEKQRMKIFDLHIGVSDFVLETQSGVSKKMPLQGYTLPNQFDIIRAKEGQLEIFLAMICPVIFSNGQAVLPADIVSEIQKHIDVYKNLEEDGLLRIVKRK